MNKKGEYSTITKGQNSPMSLNDSLIEQHLKGSKTIGVFSGSQFSKFICFDLDMIDKTQTKWITMSLINVLNDIGINSSDIHIANSGNKGIHVLLYSNEATPLSIFKSLFIITMEQLQGNLSSDIKSKLHKGNELVLEINDICNIEFRPSDSQGVKLELGFNYKNKDNNTNKCLFMDKSTFELIEDMEYFLNITPMDSNLIRLIVEEYNDEDSTIVEEAKELVKEKIKESHAHKINRDEDETIEHIKELLNNGMYTSGSRNNSVFKIARYFSYMGLDLDVAIGELKEWMSRQDKKYYTSTLEFALSECERICRNVYEKGYTLISHVENLHLYKDEMVEIMKIKEKNTKLVLFSMLLHSKRFANKDGVFYMTYSQMEEMCGLGKKGVMNNVSILEELGLIEIVERYISQKGTYIKKPNKYKINLLVSNSESMLEIDNTNISIKDTNIYHKSVTTLFTDKELRGLDIPDYQYKEIKKYRKLSA